jgi:hypothetical protein
MTAKDDQTGKTVTFMWDGKGEPTQADMEQIFSEAQNHVSQQDASVPEWGKNNPNLYGLYGAAKGLGTMVSNVPQSGAKVVQDVVGAVASPVQTAKGLMELATANPAVWGKVIENYKQRYGSLENFSNTAIQDPVGTGLDISTLATGAGGAARMIPGLAKTGQVARGVGLATEPWNAFKQVVGRGTAAAIPESVPQRLYQSAIKPSTVLGQGERTSMLETGLKEGILPTKAGLEKLQDTIIGINSEIGDKIVAGAKSGQAVDASAVVARLDDLYNGFYKNAPNASDYLSDIEKIKQKFIDNHGGPIPLDTAQEIKKTIYAINRKAYGELSTVAKESNKALARGLKEEIAGIFPEINALNARESALINLEGAIERAVGRIGNRDLVGIGTPIKGTAFGTLTGSHQAGMLAALLGSVIDTPAIKAALAVALKKAKGGSIDPGWFKTRIATYQASKLGQQGEQ